MRQQLKKGDTNTYDYIIKAEDCAAFHGQLVHPVYSTFALARDAEWCCRELLLDERDADEESIGTMLEIKHLSPALLGEKVHFSAVVESVVANAINCSFKATINKRLIAEGKQQQKILKRNKLKAIFDALKKD